MKLTKDLIRRWSVLALILTCASALTAQVAEQANQGYKTKEGRANVAKVLSAPDRDQKQKPKELVEAMSLKPGMVVADIGTGVGYMLPFLSEAVGVSGRVLAEDIFPDFLDKARGTTAEHKLSNVTFVQGTDTDPRLPENGVDVALALESYHHWDYPAKMLAALHSQLKPSGRLIVVDYFKRPNAMPGGNAVQHIRLDEDDVIKEIEAYHFRLVSHHEHLTASQYIATFERD